MAGATPTHGTADCFGDEAAGGRAGEEAYDPREEANTADDECEDAARNQRHRQCNDDGNYIVERSASIEFVLLLAYAVGTAVANIGKFGTFSADGLSTTIAAQAGLCIWMAITDSDDFAFDVVVVMGYFAHITYLPVL